MSREVSNGQDIIDSRDVIKRIAELEEFRDDSLTHLSDLKERIAELEVKQNDLESAWTSDEAEELSNKQSAIWTAEDGTEYGESSDWDEETEREWKVLTALQEEAEGYCSDWKHGETLIRDSYFEEYAQQFAEDIGAIKQDMSWPCDHINWEAAADALKMDYTSVDFDGETYWIRS